MIIVGMGQENSADRFVNGFNNATNLSPIATRVNHDYVVLTFNVVGVFISNRIHCSVNFHKFSNLIEYTATSITQKRKIRNK